MLSLLKLFPECARRVLARIPAPPALRTVGDVLIRSLLSFARDDGSHMAAGVAYYAVFSLFPLAVVTITIASFVLDRDAIQTQLLQFMEDQLPGSTSSDFVRTNVERLSAARGAVGIVAAVGLLWAARAVFGAVHRVVNRAWRVTQPPQFFWHQIGQVLGAAGAAVVLLLSGVLGIAGRLLARIDVFSVVPWNTVVTVIPFLFSMPLLILLYKYVPDRRVRWRHALPAGIVSSMVLELVKFGFAYYLANLSNLDLVYGSIATVVVMMLFFYLASLILVWGAEFSSELCRTDEAGMLEIRAHLRPVRGGLLSLPHRPPHDLAPPIPADPGDSGPSPPP